MPISYLIALLKSRYIVNDILDYKNNLKKENDFELSRIINDKDNIK